MAEIEYQGVKVGGSKLASCYTIIKYDWWWCLGWV
jgi:hypothetical protein